jgi:acetyl esterase/lipase
MSRIDYRTVNDASFPAQVEDVKTAVRFLRANAARYGLDAEKSPSCGDSAGGYLAAMLGATGDSALFETDEWAGYSSAFGRLWTGTDRSIMCGCAKPLWCRIRIPRGGRTAVSVFAGCRISDENREWLASMNPGRYLSAQTPPHLLLHGTADEMEDVQESERITTR